MSEVLAHFVTKSAHVIAYTDHVEISRFARSEVLFLYGQVARNLFGNQEFLMPLVNVSEITSIVGSTTSAKDDGAEGKAFLNFVIEKTGDDQYRIGYSGDVDTSTYISANSKTLGAVVRACRISLLSDELVNLVFDDDFWVVHAKLDDDFVSISPKFFEIITANKFKLTISRDDMGLWLEIFSAAEDLELYEPGSMIQLRNEVSLHRENSEDIVLKLVLTDREVSIRATFKFFTLCHRLMGIVWLGEDSLDEDFALVDDEDEDDDDEDEGQMT